MKNIYKGVNDFNIVYENFTNENLQSNKTQLVKDINSFNVTNANSKKYDTIDDYGNILINSNDISPTIQDGLLKDIRETLVLQNSIYIIGSIVATTCLIMIVIIR
jgi:hypothetical protein